MNKMKTCCFTGHRKIKEKDIINKLNIEIDRLIDSGVDTFLSGGALGFDQICAKEIIRRKEMGVPIKLIFLLPCKEQDKLWSFNQKKEFKNLLEKADDIIYTREVYSHNCMMVRNKKLVGMADVCLCALKYNRSGTAQTVRYANEKNIVVINVFEVVMI